MISVYCTSCGITFGVPNKLHARLKETGEPFHCTNGHELYYSPSENDKLRKKIELYKARVANLKEYSDGRNRNHLRVQRCLSATRGVVTRQRNKIKLLTDRINGKT